MDVYGWFFGFIDTGKQTEETAGSVFISQADKGIYDAMNQAVGYAKGDYLFFLNAGDSFYDKEVLYKITEVIKKTNRISYMVICIIRHSIL